MFSFKNLSHQYSPVKSISFKDWQTLQGEQWLMTGISGSGKTTLLQIISGLLEPSAGEITISGTELYKLSGAKRDTFRGQAIGLVLQKPHLIDTLSVIENLLLTQYLAGLKQDKNRIREVLQALQLSDKEKSMPHTLSQGEAQRVSIARAVLNKPKLLLADEPTASLDDINAEKVVQLLKTQAQECNATLVVSTHDNRVKPQFEKLYQL
jgi:putative ABC transport system ATP-binding protein